MTENHGVPGSSPGPATSGFIDSNGSLTINDGVIVAIGGRAPEGSFDSDQNPVIINGGILVGIGGNTSRLSNASAQNVVMLGSYTAGSTLALKASGATVFAFTIPQNYATMVISSPAITTGTTYDVYTGGTAASAYQFNGLYLGSLSYSGGAKKTSFTVSGRVTQIGGKVF